MKTTNVGIMDINVKINILEWDLKYKTQRKRYLAINMS
jgi:hypothetical protein